MQITVQTKAAIKSIVLHYADHQAEYAEQLEGWQKKMKEYSELLGTWAANGGEENRPSVPPKPDKYDSTYKRLLDMLSVHTSEQLVLEDHEYDQIFRDKFGWKSGFLASSAMYTGRMLGSVNDDDDHN